MLFKNSSVHHFWISSHYYIYSRILGDCLCPLLRLQFNFDHLSNLSFINRPTSWEVEMQNSWHTPLDGCVSPNGNGALAEQ